MCSYTRNNDSTVNLLTVILVRLIIIHWYLLYSLLYYEATIMYILANSVKKNYKKKQIEDNEI